MEAAEAAEKAEAEVAEVAAEVTEVAEAMAESITPKQSETKCQILIRAFVSFIIAIKTAALPTPPPILPPLTPPPPPPPHNLFEFLGFH